MLSHGALQQRDVLEVRSMIEVPATGYAAMRRTEADLEAIRAALVVPRRGPVEQQVLGHRAFHLAIARAGRNALCELLVHPLYPPLTEGRLAGIISDVFWNRIDTEHHEIVDAVAAGDVMAAQRAASRHVAHLREAFEHFAPSPEAGRVISAVTTA